MTARDKLRELKPPLFARLAQRVRGGAAGSAYGLSGDFHTWDEALAASSGYDGEVILEKTRTALLKVKSGQAAYERDSVLFDEIEYSWPVLAGLLWVAARCGGRLDVLDFGGSLGSAYFQNRAFLAALPEVRWNIVEQARHVETGKTYFADERLRFYDDIAGCLAETRPNVVLLGSVLQYLERPYAILDELLALPCDHLIVDRTPFWSGADDRLCVQTVPPSIYAASYPSWVFSRGRLRERLRHDWEIVAAFDDADEVPAPVKVVYEGAVFVRRNTLS